MNFHRAEEIINSGEKIEVLYKSKPVWINILDSERKIAQITDSEQNSLDVPVEELFEKKSE